MAFDTLQTERTWSGALIKRLERVAQVFANALEGKRSEEKLRQFHAETERVKDCVRAESEILRAEIRITQAQGELIGQSPPIKEVLHLVEQVAHTDSSVLIRGEAGMGKRLIAQATQRLSRRRAEGSAPYRFAFPEANSENRRASPLKKKLVAIAHME